MTTPKADPRRKILALVRDAGGDTVLLTCGHILARIASEPEATRRSCFRCGSGQAPVKDVDAEFERMEAQYGAYLQDFRAKPDKPEEEEEEGGEGAADA